MNKKCLTAVVFLLLIILAGGYKFVIQGEVSMGEDGRVAINLTDAERNMVLSEMRTFLSSIQKISAGVAENNYKKVVESARTVGNTAQGEIPGTLVAKLPIGFKKLGFDTHKKFDQIAMDAESMEDAGLALSQVSELMLNCVACHETYKFIVSKE